MTEFFLIFFLVLAVLLVGAGLGYWLGWRQCEYAHEAEAERMSLIDPPPRTAGQPTNLDGAPSRVTKARSRPGHVHDIPTNYGEPRR